MCEKMFRFLFFITIKPVTKKKYIRIMQSIWTGSISFGLINIPIKLFTAVQDSSLDLDMLDSKDHSHIRFKRVNETTGQEVENADIVKGYLLNDNYIPLETNDFKAAAPEKTKTIQLINFTYENEIDSIYYEQPYYLEPEKEASAAYALLRDSLTVSGKVGVTSFVLRNKEILAILKPYKNVIVLNRIRFTQEIRGTSELKLPPVSKTKTREMDMANKLIEQLTEKFDIATFKDTYSAKLLEIVKEKSKGNKVTPPKMKQTLPQSDNLLEMLKISLEKTKSKTA